MLCHPPEVPNLPLTNWVRIRPNENAFIPEGSSMTDIARLFQAFLAPAIFSFCYRLADPLDQRAAYGYRQPLAAVCTRKA